MIASTIDTPALWKRHVARPDRRESTAIATPAMDLLLRLLDAERPASILEVGSGLSTAVFASWANVTGSELYTVDEEPWLTVTAKELNAEGLAVDAELTREQLDGWLDEGGALFDFIFLDEAGTLARPRTLAALLDADAVMPGALVVCDDFHIPHGREAMLDLWRWREFTEITEHTSTVDRFGRYMASARWPE